MIDLQRNLSAEEHLLLYWYSVMVENSNVGYENFRITESLIMRFNRYMHNWRTEFYNNPADFEKPVDWDRTRTKTEYFRQQLAKGHEFEIWAQGEFKRYGLDIGGYNSEKGQFTGENKFGIEIKYDMRMNETGNIYIEYSERLKSSQNWIKSGILKDDNTKYWLVGNESKYFIFQKQTLLNVYSRLLNNQKVAECRMVEEKLNGTSKGFIMSVSFAGNIAFADSIGEFVRKADFSDKSKDLYFAFGMFVHGRRDCRYIKGKSDNFLKVFDSLDEAFDMGYHRCNNPNCFL